MVVISVQSPADLDDHLSISRKKNFFEIPVLPLREEEDRNFFFFFQGDCLSQFI
jgi:hypothetical protein